MEKAWVIKDADRHFYRLGVRRATQGMPFVDEKNPARAYTFSLFFWGAGQSYLGQRLKSVFFQAIFLAFVIVIGLVFLHGKDLVTALQENEVSLPYALLWAETMLLGVLIFWLYNACDAYHGAVKSRRIPFRGIQSRVLPMLSSLLIPGWGQFMNGQPVKGLLFGIFSVLSVFTLCTLPAVLYLWAFLDPSPSRSLIESLFAGSVLYAPLIPVISLLSSYDALKVSLNDIKKDSPLDRIVLAISRFHSEGFARSAARILKLTAVPSILLFLLVLVTTRYDIPLGFYSAYLRDAQEWLQQQGMTVVPRFIDRLLS
jgi:TM2 domain-containing membrane protein YozV